MTDRLVELEAKALALKAEIAALKAGKPAPQPPMKDVREVSITAVLDERSDLPNLKEMQKLYSVVRALSPWPLDTRYDSDKPFRGFCACFRWLATKGRSDHPNPKSALGFWLDDCKTWLRDRNSMASDIDATTMILAVYASGDIAYVPANGVLGHTVGAWARRTRRQACLA
jgi:hypothetical protein